MIVGKAQILEAVSKLSLVEVTELIAEFEKRFGISAKAPVLLTIPTQTPSDATPVEEKTEFTVRLTGYPADKKVAVIKVVREITGLGLKEAKDVVETAPSMIKENITKADSEAIKTKLGAVGATVEIE